MLDVTPFKVNERRWRRRRNAKFTLHDFSPIFFHSPTGFDKSPSNGRHRRQIGARSRKWQSRSVNYQRRDLRESPKRRRHPLNIWHAKYLELSAIHNPAVWAHSQWESKMQGNGKFGEDFLFYFVFIFYIAINVSHLQTMRIHFGIRIYRSGIGYMKMKKGLGFFL